MNHEGGVDWDSLESFVSVSSPFYPELGAWFARYLSEWIDVQRGRRRRGFVKHRKADGQLSLVTDAQGD